jgi:hypothetical protein
VEIFTGWEFRVLEFCFFFLFFCVLPSVVPAGKYSVWSAEGLPNTFEAGGQWASRQWDILAVYCGVEKPSTSWGFRVPKFQPSLMLCLAKGVSRVSARSLIHRAHAVCIVSQSPFL